MHGVCHHCIKRQASPPYIGAHRLSVGSKYYVWYRGLTPLVLPSEELLLQGGRVSMVHYSINFKNNYIK